jgi:hypothetical protein
LGFIKYKKYKSFINGAGGNFIFNHPIKFYNLGLSLFIFKFFYFLFKKINYNSDKWLYKLDSFKTIYEKSIESAELLKETNKSKSVIKYYDMYSFATLIICLAEKNNLEYPKEFINNILKPFKMVF